MEFGVVVKVKKSVFAKEAVLHVRKAFDDQSIKETVYQILLDEAKKIEDLLKKEADYDRTIKEFNKQSKRAKRIETIPGIGSINASILSIQPMESYEDSRDYSASLGLVPKQSTTGGKVITKQGNRYIRTMLLCVAEGALHFRARLGGPTAASYIKSKQYT